MDIIPIAGMLFVLLVILVITGAILTYPLFRRLGQALDVYLEERKKGALPASDARQLEELIRGLHVRLESLEDRQRFVERLVDERTPELPESHHQPGS